MKHRLVLALVALSLAFSATACRRIEKAASEKAIEEGTGAKKVDFQNGGVTVVGPQGEQMQTGTNVSLPDGWPTSRVPAYPGWTLQAGMGDAKGTLSCVAETKDPASKVVAFYKDKLSSNYKQEANAQIGGMSTVTFKSSGGEEVAVVANDGGGKTSITISISPKK